MTVAYRDTPLLDEMLAWRDRPAQADLRGLPAVNVPALARLRSAIPAQAAQRMLAAAYATSLRLSRQESLLRAAGADSLDAMRARPLADCDALARKMARQSGWLAGGSGAVFGLGGAAGMVADAPALLLIGLRALMRMAYCYGESPSPALVAALFALAAADTEEEKQLAWKAALTTREGASVDIQDAAMRDGLERAAEREFAKQALAGSLQKLTVTLVQRLGMKKAAGVLPFVGAAVGGAVNLRFVYLLTEAARMAFIARRMHAQGMTLEKLLSLEPLVAVATPRKKAMASAKARATRRRPSPTP